MDEFISELKKKGSSEQPRVAWKHKEETRATTPDEVIRTNRGVHYDPDGKLGSSGRAKEEAPKDENPGGFCETGRTVPVVEVED